uniref:Uncharacterized protein AlNc14C156G7648 n=1 Tax=Albugo laibachii Nc14 TaxID=890382 RepID=F0WMF8_9STRA|nr:conserved hypothetical protein [Albugo laibachii Nc14]|eukprot:CCA22490.1 conserved hypothetical protein [Albugo laibachii Nc14]
MLRTNPFHADKSATLTPSSCSQDTTKAVTASTKIKSNTSSEKGLFRQKMSQKSIVSSDVPQSPAKSLSVRGMDSRNPSTDKENRSMNEGSDKPSTRDHIAAGNALTNSHRNAAQASSEPARRRSCTPNIHDERPVRIRYLESEARNGKRPILHASLGKLIVRLTDSHHVDDTQFRDIFLLTYPCFCTPYEFVKKLMKRYVVVRNVASVSERARSIKTQVMLKDTRDDQKETGMLRSTTIHTETEAHVSVIRLINLLKFWIKESGYIQKDLEDGRAAIKLNTFLTEIQSDSPISSARQLAESLQKSIAQLIRRSSKPKQQNSDKASSPARSSEPQSGAKVREKSPSHYRSPASETKPLQPETSRTTRSVSDSLDELVTKKLDASQPPKLSRGFTGGQSKKARPRKLSEDATKPVTRNERASSLNFDNIAPLSNLSADELATQLTLLEADHYFAKVGRRELTNKAWTRTDKYIQAPNVMALIELFDATAEWVSSEILHPQLQAADRAKVIVLFIEAASICHQLNNFDTLFEIMTGLSAPCVRHLKSTWGLVPVSASEKHQVLLQICSPEDNYRCYRHSFKSAEGSPRLPCWFILVKDLFSYEDAIPSMQDGLVNWQKFCKLYHVIQDALYPQNFGYLSSEASFPDQFGKKERGKILLNVKAQNYIRHRLDRVRKNSHVLYQLAHQANTQESLIFVNTLSEAGFL